VFKVLSPNAPALRILVASGWDAQWLYEKEKFVSKDFLKNFLEPDFSAIPTGNPARFRLSSRAFFNQISP
jgi:hypothetical protein